MELYLIGTTSVIHYIGGDLEQIQTITMKNVHNSKVDLMLLIFRRKCTCFLMPLTHYQIVFSILDIGFFLINTFKWLKC